MPAVTFDKLIETVRKSSGIKASAKAALLGVVERVNTAVMAALDADENADAATNAAVQEAIDGVVAEIEASDADLASAIQANP